MKSKLVTKRKQRELFEKVYEAGEEFINTDEREEHYALGERYDGMCDTLEFLGLLDEYQEWCAKNHPPLFYEFSFFNSDGKLVEGRWSAMP